MTHKATFDVGWSYESSPNAVAMGFAKEGCWTVNKLGNGRVLAVKGFQDKDEAEVYKDQLLAEQDANEAHAAVLAESGANPSHASLAAEIAKLREQRRVLREACEHFVNKVDTGMAHSRDSYARFQKALEATKD